jgi:transcriptional regulator with XRE-family HTH domain
MSETGELRKSAAEPSEDTERRKRVFRENFTTQIRRTGISLNDLSSQTGIDMPTLRRWRRSGVAQPKHEHIERLAEIFGLTDPWSLMEPEGNSHGQPPKAPTNSAQLDRSTNPLVSEVHLERPELFTWFTRDDWDELFSQHGTGGPLTTEGVVAAAERINAKRDARRKFEAILETEHLDLLCKFLDVLYRDTSLPWRRNA